MPDDDTLTPASRDDLVQALAYGLTHRTNGKPHRAAGDAMARIAADTLVQHLEMCGFVVMKRPPGKLHSTPTKR
jgi:hypothetical protein